MSRVLTRTCVLALLLGSLNAPASAQTGLEAAKRAYFEGRFEESVRLLEPLQATASDRDTRREVAFFLGLNRFALGEEERGRSHFESAVRHDPTYEPPEELFNPTVVGQFASVRSTLVGRLVVESTPGGASVRVGADELGVTPLQVTVLAGPQLVQLSLDGFLDEENRVDVRAGEDSNLTVTLRPANATASGGGGGGGAPQTTTSSGSGGGGGISGTTIGIIAGAGAAAGVGVALAGGESEDPSDDFIPGGGGTQPSSASFSVAIVPSPLTARPSGDPDFEWLIEFNVVIQESNGVGGNADFVDVKLRSGRSGNLTDAVNFGAGEIMRRAGTNQIAPRGRIEIPIGIVYRFSGGTSSGDAVVEVQLTDARGNRTIGTAQAPIR